MARLVNTLFARLFSLFLLAIALAHALGWLWLKHYEPAHLAPPPPPPFQRLSDEFVRPPPEGWAPPPPPMDGEEPPPRWGGPVIVLVFQVVALVAAAALSARWLTRPIRELSAAAERLSENLDSPPLTEQGPDELKWAARTFNRMQQRIREQIHLRSQLLTAVSHDLRTPLARMRLRVEQVTDDSLRQRLSLDVSEMAGLLESTLSYIQAQSATEPVQRLDIQALVESLAEDARDNGADVRVEGQCRPLAVQPLALRSCLSNLLSNALRYAGQAQFQLQETAEFLEIRICDSGPGIPVEQRARVFEPFFRLEHSRNRAFGGTGLGLSIAREAARRQGGDLWLADTPGGGLTVVLRLPREQA